MRHLAVAMSLVLASSAFAEPARSRGWLSGVGVGLVGLGLGFAGFGLSQQLIASDPTLAAYGTTPAVNEAPALVILDKRAKTAGTNALIGFVSGAVLVAAGVVLLLLDAPPPVAVVPMREGGAVVFSGRF